MPDQVSGILELKSLKPVASGRMRLVFCHPHRPDLLVKVIRPEMVEAQWGSSTPWFKSKRRFKQYVMFVREVEEHIASYAKHGRQLDFMQTVVGLAETDCGLGIVLEAVFGRDGEIAPTLWQLINSDAFNERAKIAMERFFDQLLNSSILVADVHPGNLVYCQQGEDEPRFVMIDGFGASNLIPFKTLFPSLNARSKAKKIKRLRARIALRVADLAAKSLNPLTR